MEYDPEIHDELANKILTLLGENPHLTIDLLASQTDSTIDNVTFVIDEFLVTDDIPEHVGPGRGGGWVEEETRASLVQPGEPLFIGHRWPDGSLNTEEAFDLDNPDHLAAMGLKRVEG